MMRETIDVYKSSFSGKDIDKGTSDHHDYEFKLNEDFGLCLFMDGILQSTSRDQALYHKAMVGLALQYNSKLEHVLIVGGGGGGVLHRLFQKTNDLTKTVKIVDIDQKLFELAKRHLRGWNNNEFSDSRVEISFEDGADFLRKTKEKYDAIFLDVGDPLSFTKSHLLYKKEVYHSIQNSLLENGMLVFHTAAVHTSDNALFQSFKKRFSNELNAYHHHALMLGSFEYEWMFNVIQKKSQLSF